MITNPEVRLAMLKELLGEVATKKDLEEQKIELKEDIDNLRRELREFKKEMYEFRREVREEIRRLDEKIEMFRSELTRLIMIAILGIIVSIASAIISTVFLRIVLP